MTKIIVSGFGGQGIMSLGKILAKAALEENKHTAFLPSYGAEMRGGTAHCFVNISCRPIASVFIECPDIAIILNQPALDKFGKKVKRGGLLILNADLIRRKIFREDVSGAIAPLNKIALECGNIKAANSVALGMLIRLKPGLFKKETVVSVLREAFKNEDVFASNLKALERGEEVGKS